MNTYTAKGSSTIINTKALENVDSEAEIRYAISILIETLYETAPTKGQLLALSIMKEAIKEHAYFG